MRPTPTPTWTSTATVTAEAWTPTLVPGGETPTAPAVWTSTSTPSLTTTQTPTATPSRTSTPDTEGCRSDVPITKPRLVVASTPFKISFKGEALIPLPWTGIEPATRGLRLVIRHGENPVPLLDITIPGGAGWHTHPAGSKWTYLDRSGVHGGIRRIVVKDRQTRQPGLLSWTLAGKSVDVLAMPAAAGTLRAELHLGDDMECASQEWSESPAAGVGCRVRGGTWTCR